MFISKLRSAWKSQNSLLCIGLDPDREQLPLSVRQLPLSIFEFNRRIIDATADLVCAYKPQIAHYSAQGAEHELELTLTYLREQHPHLPIVLDAKRGDIGSTAEKYAEEVFDRFQADAVTVNPYLGADSLEPFLRRSDKGVIVLCRTSNPGAKDFQDLDCNGQKLYERVAEQAAYDWNKNGNVLLVAGATDPKALGRIRQIVGDMPLLVPGLGTQGASVESVVRHGVDSQGEGLMISSSRSIMNASKDSDFAVAARKVAMQYRDEINLCRDIRLIHSTLDEVLL